MPKIHMHACLATGCVYSYIVGVIYTIAIATTLLYIATTLLYIATCILPLMLLLLLSQVVNVTGGEVPPFSKLVTITEYSLDDRNCSNVQLFGGFKPLLVHADPVCELVRLFISS